MGKNIEIEPCAIREQRKWRHCNILNTTWLQRYSAAPGGSLERNAKCGKVLKIKDFRDF